MKFNRTFIDGLYTLVPEPIEDERGFFSVVAAPSPATPFAWRQTNVSYNKLRGTLRGLHFQTDPYAQKKIVRCIKGTIQDVAVDMRLGSPTYKKWFAAMLSGTNRESLFIPTGFLHGYLTLEDDTEVEYMVDALYDEGSCGGFRWNDPAFDIKWMIEPVVMSEGDAAYPDF